MSGCQVTWTDVNRSRGLVCRLTFTYVPQTVCTSSVMALSGSCEIAGWIWRCFSVGSRVCCLPPQRAAALCNPLPEDELRFLVSFGSHFVGFVALLCYSGSVFDFRD